jgi:hypothetical protein
VSLKNGNQTPQKLHGYEYISSTGFIYFLNLGKFFKIGNKGNRKENFIFWKFKDQKICKK